MSVLTVFQQCVEAIRRGALIHRISSTDKEFHFQNWFRQRLIETGENFEMGGRNAYPDFRLVATTDGYELKGLAYPGRDATFDSNSQMPTGAHNGRAIYYVFGRYPKAPDGDSYPVLDLVVCHGDFLNADHDYVHQNKSIKGFGTYGDILIRDRKMYVVPTPFRLIEGAAHRQTLILHADVIPPRGFIDVGELRRKEAKDVVVGYSFDLTTNALSMQKARNPHAGMEHIFRAWRAKGSPRDRVKMRENAPSVDDTELDGGDSDE